MSADLWTFATTLYARPGVEAACLQLQAAGADVCLVLCGLWLDGRGVAHDDEHERQLRQLAAPWQLEVVVPLRKLRQQWRQPAQQDPVLDALRQQVKRLELEAEREQLQRLQALAQTWPQRVDTRRSAWLQALTPEACSDARQVLQMPVKIS